MEAVFTMILLVCGLIVWEITSMLGDLNQVIAELKEIRRQLDTTANGTLGYNLLRQLQDIEKTNSRPN